MCVLFKVLGHVQLSYCDKEFIPTCNISSHIAKYLKFKKKCYSLKPPYYSRLLTADSADSPNRCLHAFQAFLSPWCLASEWCF